MNTIDETTDTSVLKSQLYPERKFSFFSLWRTIFKNIHSHLFFLRQLVRIAIIGEFKRSYIGIAWLFILPIVSVIIWIILNSAGIIEPGDTGIPYPAYVLLSTSIWEFFAGMYRSTSNILNSRGDMLITTRFPHEVLVAEKILVHLIRFIIPFFINIAVLLFFGVRFTWLALVFPLTMVPLLFLGVGIGLIVSLLRVVAEDAARLFDGGIVFLMFLTPVVYAPNVDINWLAAVINFNPLTYLVGFSRDILIQGNFYEPGLWVICSLLCLIFFFFAVRIFMIAESKVVERMFNT